VSTTRNVPVTVNRAFSQWDGSSVTMSGYANADFGVNKAAVSITGANAPNKYQTFGSVAPDQTFADQYINNFNYNTYNYEYDANNNRYVSIASGVNYHFDATTNDLVFDQAGSVFQPSWSQGGDSYFVPNQPEVTIDLQAQRNVTAYSRWEDIFYFKAGGGHPPNSGGLAKFTLSIDGSLIGDYTASYQLMVRDWLNKDSYGNYLAYQYESATAAGSTVNSTIDVLVPFTYGQPDYIKTELWASLYGEGDIDLSHTVKIESVTLPEGDTIFSYGSYLNGGGGLGFNVIGGIDGNGVPGGAGGYFNGGGGGGGNPVPVPGAVWLLGSGLVGLAMRVRRKAV
jgi:hypothetical protein